MFTTKTTCKCVQSTKSSLKLVILIIMVAFKNISKGTYCEIYILTGGGDKVS